MKKFWFLIIPILLSLHQSIEGQTFVFDFQNGFQGWTGDFADYPASDSLFYQLDFRRTTLPGPLDTARYALMISGNNHSDDLFMFLKRKITGLHPNKIYKLQIDIELASNAPTHAIGIGGAPGEGVTLKAGATLVEPQKKASDGFYVMNIDKSNQVSPGADMDTLGNIGVADTTRVFTLINRSNAGHLFTISTDNEGFVWVCIGTDSGFEGTTTLYYSLITLTFDLMTGMENPVNDDASVLYPNPADDFLAVADGGRAVRLIELFNNNGQLVIRCRNSNRINVKDLAPGTYTARVTCSGSRPFSRRVVVR
jgi:hypothetical protein